ncbi:MAG: response regulator [Halobacteriota archaeon]|nr:response regulator [Halobacteriota archaeon]
MIKEIVHKGYDKVLIIDDSKYILKTVEALLEDEGYVNSISASSGEEGIAIARSEIPDLIILDVMMPGDDGYKICKRLKEIKETSHIPIIMLTARNSINDVKRGFDAGAVDYIGKPFERNEFVARVKSALLLNEFKNSNKDKNDKNYAIFQKNQATIDRLNYDLRKDRFKDRINPNDYGRIDYDVEGVKRMRGMIHDLMDLSSISAIGRSLKPVECEKVLDHVISSLDAQIEDSGAIILREPLPVIVGDTSQLIELFSNLITNAINYRGSESPRIQISSEERGGNWVFSVRDNGLGIDPGDKERIFKIFRRFDKRRSGNGIDLATCKKIVQHHSGRIWVESQPGEGTTFYFTIPVMKGEKDER